MWARCSTRCPDRGSTRVHRAHLVSAKAAVCIDEHPIRGKTNELGAICEFTSQLIATFKRTEIFEAIITDAGNCSLEHASLINEHDLGYILAIKAPAGEIHKEAIRTLSSRTAEVAEHTELRREKGKSVVHRIFPLAASHDRHERRRSSQSAKSRRIHLHNHSVGHSSRSDSNASDSPRTPERRRHDSQLRKPASYRAQENGRHRPIPYPARGGRTRSDSDRLRQAKPTVAKREVLRCSRGGRRSRIEH